MHYPRLLARLRSSRWGIQPASLQAIYDSLGAHLRGDLSVRRVHAARADDLEDMLAPSSQPEPSDEPAGPVAVIEVRGIIGKHLSALETMCGGCDIECVQEQIAAAVADQNVKAILLDFDSPGGVVTGVPELAAKLREWRAVKPIFSYTESLCASAAYWLAAQGEAVFATLTADLGSIGVYIALTDDSEWWKQQGFKLELIKAGEFKAMGISGKSLTDAERALLQSDVDTIYGLFTADVRAGRPGVADETMQGQTFLGQSAVAAKLADAIVPDRDAVVAVLQQAYAPDWQPSVVAPAPRPVASAKPRAEDKGTAPVAETEQREMHIHLTMPAINVAAPSVSVTTPPVNVHVDARLEKDAITVKPTAPGAKKITYDASGKPSGVEPVPAS